ncbi:MAG: threonine-phosphate decarboxylase CobD [Candidatus Omnitrophota bacterium]
MEKFSHGGNIYGLGGNKGKRIYDFSANINPLGIPRQAQKVLRSQINEVVNYPDPQARKLVAEIADYWKIKPENVLVGNGSAELLYDIVRLLKPKTACVPIPSFSEYERALKIADCRINFLRLKENEDFAGDLTKVQPADMFLFGHPNNPTANMIAADKKTLLKLRFKHFVADEAFMDFVPGENKYSFIKEAVKNKKLTVLRTFTKFFALPGLRIGYVAAHKDVIAKLREIQVPWTVNVMAQLAALEMLRNKAYAEKTKILIAREQKWLFDELRGIAFLKVYPSLVNFLLVKIKRKNITAEKLRECLIRKGVLIRDCANFRGLGKFFFRVAVRTRKENKILVKGLKVILCR